MDFDITNLRDNAMHLTNNSVVSKSKKAADSGIEGNTWSMEEMQEYLLAENGWDVVSERVRPQIKRIVKNSLQAVVDAVDNRRNSFEFVGYDFMVDDEFNVWLLEVNKSPTLK